MCTSFALKDKDGSYVYGRTLEFGRDLEESLLLIPRQYSYQGSGPDGVSGSGLNWIGKYAVIGVNIFGLDLLLDGMNEKGLSAGLLNLPNSADYQKPTGADAKNSIASYQMLNYALSNFATVDEVKLGFQKIFVNSSELKAWNGVPKCHMTLHDLQGKSIVIEYLEGKLVITDNPIGVMTNDPPMAWQLINVGNYINLSPLEKDPITFDGETFAPPSSGSGLHGLPGDFLSPSRFLRAFEYSMAAAKYAPDQPKVELAWRLVNMFDIPPGSVMIPPGDPYAGGVSGWEYTQTSIVADAKNLTYYVRNFKSLNIKKFELMSHDLTAKVVQQFQIGNVTTYETIQ
jgi:choloylglycine hydrolase